jgi:hypothetical protein
VHEEVAFSARESTSWRAYCACATTRLSIARARLAAKPALRASLAPLCFFDSARHRCVHRCVLIGTVIAEISARRKTLWKRSCAGNAALLLLSFLWACDTLQPDLLPGLRTSMGKSQIGEAISLLMLAFAAGVLAWIRKSKWPQGRHFWTAVLIGLGLFVVPGLLVRAVYEEIPAYTRTALFMLVPVFAVVLEPYIGTNTERPIQGGLISAMAAMIGGLLVFPTGFRFPASIEGCLAFVAVVLAAACVATVNCWACCEMVRTASRQMWMPTAAIAGAASALALAASSLILKDSQTFTFDPKSILLDLLWIAGIDLPALLLLFWLLPRMRAPRMAARFVLAPILAILIGIILLRPEGGLRGQTWLGLLWMAGGAGYLLFAPQGDVESASLSIKSNGR